MSGTGIIAEGVEFHDGQVAVSWFGQHHILEVSKDLDTWLAVHGHDGRTEIVDALPSMRPPSEEGTPVLRGEAALQLQALLLERKDK